MFCVKCKTVELIRLEDSPYNVYPIGKSPKPPVDRCPCCGLQWPVKAVQRTIAPVLYESPEGARVVQDSFAEQLDMFTNLVGGFALNDQ